MWKYTQSFRLTDVNQSFDGTRRSRDACGSVLNLYFLRNLYETRQSRIGLIPPPDWEPGNIGMEPAVTECRRDDTDCSFF